MASPPIEEIIIGDVKCYYCGHVNGQIVSRRGGNPRAGRFIPRRGYQGPEVKTGSRLRCERCQGPVFVEDATPMARAEGALARTLRAQKDDLKKAKRVA